MKRITYSFILFISFTTQILAQQYKVEDYTTEIQEISSPDFDWATFDSDYKECKFKKGALVLECKQEDAFACTTTELEFDASNVDFIIEFQMEPDDLNDKHPFGIVFDYKNDKNFQTLCFGKKQFQLLSYESGEKAAIKEGLYKLSDKHNVIVTLIKKDHRLDFYIGSERLPLTSLRKFKLQHSNIGFYVENKTKIKLTGVGYNIILENETDVDDASDMDVE